MGSLYAFDLAGLFMPKELGIEIHTLINVLIVRFCQHSSALLNVPRHGQRLQVFHVLAVLVWVFGTLSPPKDKHRPTGWATNGAAPSAAHVSDKPKHT